ncbi:Hypp6511 [Branchiostoma lanceolatum]|uniref:Hypp6511 protein n=1 Tax=Branchiostoma lanceolatum TaxID=7740 RepID=A0A8J9YUY2_BRALA|nr:Hypp6511 [Branchiostoma lanceolatum]
MLDQLQWAPLQDRRHSIRLNILYKIQHGKASVRCDALKPLADSNWRRRREVRASNSNTSTAVQTTGYIPPPRWEVDGIMNLVANQPDSVYKSFPSVHEAENFLKIKCLSKDMALRLINRSKERCYKAPLPSPARDNDSENSPDAGKRSGFGLITLSAMLNVLTTPFRASQEDPPPQAKSASAWALNLDRRYLLPGYLP